jgi:hypothetical protein
MRTFVHFQTLSFKDKSETFKNAAPISSAPTDELIYFPYADILGVGLVTHTIDGAADKVEAIRQSKLDQLELSAEEAIDIAVNNLHQISSEPFRKVQVGFYTSPWKDQYDGARLLLTELFSNLKVDGEVVALTPTPGTLFVTGSKDLTGIELMMSIAATLRKEPNAVLSLPLVLRDGLWAPLIVPIDDPIFDIINSNRISILSTLYKEQDPFLADGKVDKHRVYPTSFTVDRDKTLGYEYCKTKIYAGSVHTIPECDIIEFFQKDKAGKNNCVARAPFEKVVELLPSSFLKKEPGFRPARWRFNNFPRPVELQTLGLMPNDSGHWSLPDRSEDEIQRKKLEKLVSITIPPGAILTSESDAKNKETILEFVVPQTIDQLKDFYQAQFKIGNLIGVPTEQGPFTIAESLGAACSREAWFGPGKVEGEIELRLVKRVNFNTPALHTAFVTQNELLRQLEQFFDLSLAPDMQPQGEMQVSIESAMQNFASPDTADAVVQFFRIQMSGPQTMYTSADKSSPHTIIDMSAGLIVTVNVGKPREITQFSITKSVANYRS